VALCDYKGGRIAREAKKALPSAWSWANGNQDNREVYVNRGLEGAVRFKDPFFGVQAGWIIRRLAPDCACVELNDLPEQRNEYILFRSMGWETANWQLGSPGAAQAILADLQRRDTSWLIDAVKAMFTSTKSDHKDWKCTA
jgi:hypothetical protein